MVFKFQSYKLFTLISYSYVYVINYTSPELEVAPPPPPVNPNVFSMGWILNCLRPIFKHFIIGRLIPILVIIDVF